MLFALEVAAFVAAAFLLSALPRSRTRLRSPAHAAAALVVACGAALALAGTAVGLDWLRDTRSEELARTGDEATRLGGESVAMNEPFIDWVRERLEPGDTVHLVGADPRLDFRFQWFTFRVLPHTAVADPADADVLVFHGRAPSGFDRRRFGPAERFEPDFHIARRRAG